MITDMRILELLASKICHDLVSPVGAINNGVELIEDIGGDVVEEAMQLIHSSAEQASRRLRLFRLAYGRAGADSNLTFKDTQETLADHFEHSKIKLHFADDFPLLAMAETRGAFKALLNLALLAEETLVYGGDIHFRNAPIGAGLTLVSSGRGAALSEASHRALKDEAAIDDITPRSVHAYVTGRFAALYSLNIVVEAPVAEQVMLHLSANAS